MPVRWSPNATNEFSRIIEHIRKDSPDAALRTAKAIYDRAVALSTFPYRGRIGRVQGTRELPLTPLPFIVVYRILPLAVEIANILHGAQRWP